MNLSERIARLCLDQYKSLPRRGKPEEKSEWTLLAGIVRVVEEEKNEKCQVVALGTGTKCIGAAKMTKTGTMINDSHAEIIARRAFLRLDHGMGWGCMGAWS